MSTVRELTPKRPEPRSRNVARTSWPFTQNIEEFFENIFNRGWMEPVGLRRPLLGGDVEGLMSMRLPLIDLIDRDDELLVRAELPGVKKNEIDLTITDEGLNIVVDRKHEKEMKDERFYRSETFTGHLERSVMFPVDVDSEKAKAELKDGVLEIMLPKVQKVTRRNIKIS